MATTATQTALIPTATDQDVSYLGQLLLERSMRFVVSSAAPGASTQTAVITTRKITRDLTRINALLDQGLSR